MRDREVSGSFGLPHREDMRSSRKDGTASMKSKLVVSLADQATELRFPSDLRSEMTLLFGEQAVGWSPSPGHAI
ncbi:MAG: hypothetical protein ABSG76_26040, partial [Xanthobacteraceae bacterium]